MHATIQSFRSDGECKAKFLRLCEELVSAFIDLIVALRLYSRVSPFMLHSASNNS